MTEERPFKMTISLDVLHHLGIGLYSNIPAVLSELVANAWDADATRVDITLDTEQPSIEIRDNGHGMSYEDINDKFLTVGYRRRERDAKTPGDRDAMGRKGIGKLAAFSIADTVDVHTSKRTEANAFRMDTGAIQKSAKDSQQRDYQPERLSPEVDPETSGTLIKLTNLRRQLTWTGRALRKRLARRFSVIGSHHDFSVWVDGERITIADRDYFKDMEFIWHFGAPANDWDFSKAPSGDSSGALPAGITVETPGRPPVSQQLRGFIGTVRKPQNLDDVNNAIVLSARGRLIHEDMLTEYRDAGYYGEYIVGEVVADFLDDDNDDDIVTSGRQRVNQDDQRYAQVKDVVGTALKTIKYEWAKRRAAKSAKRAFEYPTIRKWYQRMGPDKQQTAKRMFGKIEALRLDDDEAKYQLYRASMLAFEKLALKDMLSALDALETDRDFAVLLRLMTGIDQIEETSYREIVEGRLKVIRAFRSLVPDALESILRDYVFDHLWLLHPSWDRATENAHMEQTVTAEFKKIRLSKKEKRGRIDIRYRTTARKHVIIELKRRNLSIDVHDLAKQLDKYRSALRKCLKVRFPEEARHIECVAILGKPPTGSHVDRVLLASEARYITYDQLILEAQRSYKEYLEAEASAAELSQIIEDLRNDFRLDAS